MGCGRMASVLAFVAGCCSMCQAGYYEVSYSGGSATIVGPNGTPWTRNYGTIPFGDRYGGSWYSRDEPAFPLDPPASYGTVTCSGQITVTMTWIKTDNDADDTPPPYVLIVKDSIADWSGDTGSCANGLGHSPVPSFPSYGYQESSGVTYELVAGDDEIVRYITPSAYALLNNPPQGEATTATAGVSIKYTAVPIEIKLTGVLHADTDRRILIGQNLGAYVSIGGLPLGSNPTYSWNVSGGSPFQSWNINSSNDTATVTPFTTQTTATLSTYLRSPTIGSEFTVTCSFYWPWLGATLNLTESGSSEKPSVVTSVLMVDPEVTPNLYDPDYVQLIQSGSYPAQGIKWYAEVDTPDPFDDAGDGWWTIVQLATVSRTRDGLVPWDPRPDPDLSANGINGLDSSFPYPTLWGPPPVPFIEYDFAHTYEFDADGSNEFAADSPLEYTFAQSTQVLDSFDTYYLYYPPGTAQYVPLKSLEWYWKAHLHSQSAPYDWVWDVQESAWDYTGDYPPHPTWSYRHDTRYWEYRSP